MKNLIRALILVTLLLPAMSVTAHAEPGHGHRWHNDMYNRHGRDLHYWRTGHWYQGVHGGRSGWWWVLGPRWYSYAAPVYPYPSPYYPATMTAPAAGYAYYCPRPRGYYPYVEACTVPWRAMPRY